MKHNPGLKFEANFDIENIKARSIPQQLRHRLRTFNCNGNRQYPRNWCLRAHNLPTNRNNHVIKRTHNDTIIVSY